MKTSSYEEFVISLLKKEKIKFVREKTFSDLKRGKFRFDFFIDSTPPIIIEVDGEFHWFPIFGRHQLLKQQEYDRRKNAYCLAKGFKLYRIPYWELKTINTFKDLIDEKFLVKSKYHNDMLSTPK